MAQHGYLRDYDEGRDRDDDRERSWRGGRNFMLGGRDRDDDRGYFDRMGDRARDMFGDDDGSARGSQESDRSRRDHGMSGYGREHGYGGFQGDFSRSGRDQGGFGGRGDWERSPRNFRSHQDDHYRSWRDRQMEALDRDYAEYCREREQQFHQDFDTWRSQRGNNPGPLRTGMTQTGQSHDPSGTLELTNEARENAEPQADPMDAATLGTNSSSGGGR
jgi:hypothetical protein